MLNRGGHWKLTDNEIIEKYDDGSFRVRFKPTKAHLVPQAMTGLTDNYTTAISAKKHAPLIFVPLAIFDFLCIHPFSDGKGRISRLLTFSSAGRSAIWKRL